MKKYIALLALVILLGALVFAIVMDKEVHLFIIPHQDDELLSFGVPISEALLEGDEVHLLLLTDGSMTIARDILNGTYYCTWHDRYHDPVEENYHVEGEPVTEITKEMITLIRQKEYEGAAEALGIKSDHLHYANPRLIDQQVTPEAVRDLILELHEELGDVTLHGFHPEAIPEFRHVDHVASGRGVKLAADILGIEAHYYVEHYLGEALEELEVQPEKMIASKEVSELIQKAAKSYEAFDPEKGLYGVGYHSVKPVFDAYLPDIHNYYMQEDLH